MKTINSYRNILIIVGFVLLFVSCNESEKPGIPLSKDDARYVTEWMDLVYGIVAIERLNPPRASRAYAYATVALYEGVVHGLSGIRSLGNQLNGLDTLPEPDKNEVYDWMTVCVASLHHVMNELFKQALYSTHVEIQDLYRNQLESRRQRGIDERIIDRSVEYGRSVGEAIVHWMNDDGYNETRGLAYDLPLGPGKWIPTADYGTSLAINPTTNIVYLYDGLNAPEASQVLSDWGSDRMLTVNRPLTITNHNIAMEPFWNRIRPFVLENASVVPAIPPVPYSEERSSDFFREVLAVYETSKRLTDEHRHIAHYWADNPGETGTPPGHWIKIMGGLVNQLEVTFGEVLEMYVLTAITLADAFIACWDAKYEWNLVRPVTFIRRHIDPRWDTVLVTPPFPEYPSGHSVNSGAAARMLIHLLGEVTFIDSTHTTRFGFEPRRYNSFDEAAREAAMSRLYGGIHYPMANENGLKQGYAVADYIFGTIQIRSDQ